MVKIIEFENQYRDDAIFCVLSAKDALGRKPGLNEDLLDIESYYFKNGDAFWVAVDENDRVVGTLGVKSISEDDIWLKRLFIQPKLKRAGIGSLLFENAEQFAMQSGKKKIHTQFPDDFVDAFSFYQAKGFEFCEKNGEKNHLVKIIK